MPDISQMLRTYARERGVRLEIVEKDYALSYLLAASAATPSLGRQIVLKGGTALRKCYFPDLPLLRRSGLLNTSPRPVDRHWSGNG